MLRKLEHTAARIRALKVFMVSFPPQFTRAPPYGQLSLAKSMENAESEAI